MINIFILFPNTNQSMLLRLKGISAFSPLVVPSSCPSSYSSLPIKFDLFLEPISSPISSRKPFLDFDLIQFGI